MARPSRSVAVWVAGSKLSTTVWAQNSMPRSSKPPRMPADASCDTGIGMPIGVSTLIVAASRTPRCTNWSCSIIAVSYGAAGHL